MLNLDTHGIVVLQLDHLPNGDMAEKLVAMIDIPPWEAISPISSVCYGLEIKLGPDGKVNVCNLGMNLNPKMVYSDHLPYDYEGRYTCNLRDPKETSIGVHLLPADKYNPKCMQIKEGDLYRFEIFGQIGHIKVSGVNTYMHGGVIGSKLALLTFKKPVLMLIARGLKDCRTTAW